MIVIKNLNKEKPTKPYQVRVDASSGSPLGNPFHYMISTEGETSRNYCIDKYREWLKDQMDTNPRVLEAVLKLVDIYYDNGNKLELFCWCAPKRCHAEEVRAVVQKQIDAVELFRLGAYSKDNEV